MTDPAELNRQFAIPNLVSFDAGKGGLTRVTIKSPSADAEIYLHGAHVTRFDPKDEPLLLFMSALSHFEAGKAIRGGVPICFPWFGAKAGDPKAPAHGFARLMEWSVDSTAKTGAGAAIVLSLSSSDKTKAFWPADFSAKYTVTVGDELNLSLAVTNTGAAAAQFEEALHTYLNIGDIETLTIAGLKDVTYLDKVNSGARTRQDDELIRFAGETDRVYPNTESTCTVHDPALGRQIRIAKAGSHATVIWNPWIDKAKAMADFGDDEWPGMVCVETCNVAENAVSLAAGATHTMTAAISTLR
jgi:glucose-6-phosphate 1-epimerase